jgi:hypothetical protein
MPRTYLVFGDIEGKFDVLRSSAPGATAKGRYSVAKLIEKRGRVARDAQRRLPAAGCADT